MAKRILCWLRGRRNGSARVSLVDAGAVNAAVAALSRAATARFEVQDMLRRLCDVAAETLNVDGAGVMIVDGDQIRFVHAQGVNVDGVEASQELLQQGPCREVAADQRELVIDDLRDDTDGRWPEHTDAARNGGPCAMVALPLVSRQQTWGVLDLYRKRPGPWSSSDLFVARLLADVAVSYIAMAADRDAARRAERTLLHRNMHDDLTGLPNRALLFDRLGHALAVAARTGTSVAVLFIDLDRFKQINDTIGHAAGDTVLQTVSTRMAATLRHLDTLARLAGDEFVVICEGLPQLTPSELNEEVTQVIGRLQRALAEPIETAGVELAITASIGAALSSDASTADDLLGDADAAMYRAKRYGPTEVVRDYTSEHNRHYRRTLDRVLPRALERGELQLHYQPIVSTDTGTVTAVEALLRWEHPEHGLLPAAQFVDLAEEAGIIVPIGHWVVDQACAQLAQWQRHLNGSSPPTCYINLCPREITDSALDGAIISALDHRHLSPFHLGSEVVETAFIDTQLLPALAGHHHRGHPLSVDHFGTGHSSLSRLVELPADLAKVDRSLVANASDDPRRRALVDADVANTRHLDLSVVGAGVETETQARYLGNAGCEFLQGLHLGTPQPAQQFTNTWNA